MKLADLTVGCDYAFSSQRRPAPRDYLRVRVVALDVPHEVWSEYRHVARPNGGVKVTRVEAGTGTAERVDRYATFVLNAHERWKLIAPWADVEAAYTEDVAAAKAARHRNEQAGRAAKRIVRKLKALGIAADVGASLWTHEPRIEIAGAEAMDKLDALLSGTGDA